MQTGIGLTEASVRSCVNLMSRLFAQPEDLMEQYLDLYYQVRAAFEQERRPPDEKPLTLEAAWPRMQEMMEQTLRSAAEDQARAILDGMGLLPQQPYHAPQRTLNNPETPERSDTDDGRQIAASSAEDETVEQGTGPAEDKGKKLGRGAPKGNKASSNAAAFKRTVRERLLEARENGLTNPQLLKESALLTEDALWRIIQGHVVGIATYREIDEALDRLEAKSSISA